MNKGIRFVLAIIVGAVIGVFTYKKTKEGQKKAKEEHRHIPYGPYEAFFKRPLDVILSVVALIVLSPVLLVTAILVKVKLGSPVIFTQERPGKIDPKTGKEKIFVLYKFRTMSDERDENGKLLPDERRLTSFGKKLRASSIDELPEVFINVLLKNEMSLVGPRPQLVRDMVFMTDDQRQRHDVKPGVTGLSQTNGRNSIGWEEKIKWDLKYINNISLLLDAKILCKTIFKVLISSKSSKDETDVTDDYGDALLKEGKISRDKYDELQIKAEQILHGR